MVKKPLLGGISVVEERAETVVVDVARQLIVLQRRLLSKQFHEARAAAGEYRTVAPDSLVTHRQHRVTQDALWWEKNT